MVILVQTIPQWFPELRQPAGGLSVAIACKWHLLVSHPHVEQTRGQRQTGCNDLPGKGERVASGW